MKKHFGFFILIGFTIFGFGCESMNKKEKTINSSSLDNQTELSKEYLLGKWKSTEKDWPIEINVYENLETNQIQLDILSSENKGTFKTESGYSSFFNDDHTIKYEFSIYENQLLMLMSRIQESDSEQKEEFKMITSIRPWILKKTENDEPD